MKLYHYILKGNNALKEGILSFANNPNADLSYYLKRTGGKTTHQEIIAWMESCFIGRSRAIRAFSEPIKWYEHSRRCLKDFVDKTDLFEIDITAMDKDGLIEAVYVSPSVLDFPDLIKQNFSDEVLQKLGGIENIDYSPIDWSVCDDASYRRFAFVRYYLIVLKDGYIPPKYITKES